MMLCQAFTAGGISCCLFVALFALVLSSASEMQLNRVEIKRLTWPLLNIPLNINFLLQKLLGCFCCVFWVIVYLYYEAPLKNFSAFD